MQISKVLATFKRMAISDIITTTFIGKLEAFISLSCMIIHMTA